ncbi:unnamed protein product, partial [Porites evermanni]
ESETFALGPTTGTGNEKRRTLRKSKFRFVSGSRQLISHSHPMKLWPESYKLCWGRRQDLFLPGHICQDKGFQCFPNVAAPLRWGRRSVRSFSGLRLLAASDAKMVIQV